MVVVGFVALAKDCEHPQKSRRMGGFALGPTVLRDRIAPAVRPRTAPGLGAAAARDHQRIAPAAACTPRGPAPADP